MSIIPILMAGVMSITGIWSRWDRNDGNWDELAPLLALRGICYSSARCGTGGLNWV